MYILPRHLSVPSLSDLARRILGLLGNSTMQPGTSGYLSGWSIARHIPEASDLDVVAASDTPGNAAMIELKRAGLVEDVPDLGGRYRLTALGCAVFLNPPTALHESQPNLEAELNRGDLLLQELGWHVAQQEQPQTPGVYRVWYGPSLGGDPGQATAAWDGDRWQNTGNQPLWYWQKCDQTP